MSSPLKVPSVKAPLHTRILTRIHEEFCILIKFFLNSTVMILRVFRWRMQKKWVGFPHSNCFEFLPYLHGFKSIWIHELCWRIRNNRMTSNAIEMQNVNRLGDKMWKFEIQQSQDLPCGYLFHQRDLQKRKSQDQSRRNSYKMLE